MTLPSLNDYGLMVQTERPLHEPASSYVDIYEGNGKGRLGRAILDWWCGQGHDPSYFGPSARSKALQEARTMIAAWERLKTRQ